MKIYIHRPTTSYQLTPLFVPCQSILQFLRWGYLKVWPWKFKDKVIVQSYISYIQLPFLPCQSIFKFLRYGYFKISSWKSKVKLTGLKSRPHSGANIFLIHIHFVPCQLALPFLRYGYFKIWTWDSKVKVEVKVQGHKMGTISQRHTSFSFC